MFSSFEFHQVTLLWLYCQGWVAPSSSDFSPLDYHVWGTAWVLSQTATEGKNNSKSLKTHCDLLFLTGESY